MSNELLLDQEQSILVFICALNMSKGSLYENFTIIRKIFR